MIRSLVGAVYVDDALDSLARIVHPFAESHKDLDVLVFVQRWTHF